METIDFNEVIRDPETISVVGELLVKDNSYISNLHNTPAFKSQGSIGANQEEIGLTAGPAWFRIIASSGNSGSTLINLKSVYTTATPKTLIFTLSGGSSEGWIAKKIQESTSSYFKKIRIVSVDLAKYAVDILLDWGNNKSGYIKGSFAVNYGFVFSEDKIPVVSSELPTGETLVQEFDLLSL